MLNAWITWGRAGEMCVVRANNAEFRVVHVMLVRYINQNCFISEIYVGHELGIYGDDLLVEV